MTKHENKDLDRITILVVDDEECIRKIGQRLVRQEGYNCIVAANGVEALREMENQSVDIVVTDLAMPVMDGIELTKHVKEKFSAEVIMMTGHFKDLTYEHAITKGAKDFIQKPFTTEEFIIRINRVLKERQTNSELERNIIRMREIIDGVIQSLSLTVDARDPYTAGHQKRVAQLAEEIAIYMDLPEESIICIRRSGIMHDLGKIAIPAEILSKPSKLSNIEFDLIKTHPQVGYDILKNINFSMPIAQIVLQHHERMDGSGYPQGLTGESILPEARIIAVADVVEAIFSHRPYRPSLGIGLAITEILKNKGRRYDPDVVDACVKIVTASDFTFEK